MIKKITLVWGICGQDGTNLAEYLLRNNYIVHGIVRRSATTNTKNIEHLKNKKGFITHFGDITDFGNVCELIADIRPDEIYNLAAMSHVGISFTIPHYTCQVGFGQLNILEAVRQFSPTSKVYYASSSEIFGKVQEIPQKETTPFYPRSPYGCSKLFGYWITKNYRESYKLNCCSGILFNHGSVIRGENFVEKKITKGIVDIIKGKEKCLYLGNLDAKRDLGWSKDYIKGMVLMLQQETPDDFILATGKMYSVRQMVEETCRYLGIKIKWYGKGLNEVGKVISLNADTVGSYKYSFLLGKTIVRVSKEFYRPCEVDQLLGDASKARSVLGWKPRYNFKRIIKEMVAYELNNKTK